MANKDLSVPEKRLWATDDELRANSRLTSAMCFVPVRQLIFLRCADQVMIREGEIDVLSAALMKADVELTKNRSKDAVVVEADTSEADCEGAGAAPSPAPRRHVVYGSGAWRVSHEVRRPQSQETAAHRPQRPLRIAFRDPSRMNRVGARRAWGVGGRGRLWSFRVGKVLALTALALTFSTAPAASVEAPKWVAPIFVVAQRSVGLRWLAVPDATRCKVLRSERPGADYREIATTEWTQIFDGAVEPGVTYFSVVQAVASDGTSPVSTEGSVRVPGRERSAIAPPEWASEPTPQESTEFGKTSLRVGLRWKSDPGAIAYNVYRSTTAGKDHALLSTVAESQFVDTAVVEGTTYFSTLTGLGADFQESERSPERSVAVRAGKRREPKKRLVVVPRPTTLLWKVADAGGTMTERGLDGIFGDAFDLAYDRNADLLYVSSTFNRRILVLRGSDGTVVRQLGPRFDGHEIGLPLGLGLDAQGQLHVVDARGGAVVVLARDGGLLRVVPVPRREGGRDPRLIDVAVGPDGTAFVTDAANGQVVAIGNDGRELWRWGGQEAGNTPPARVTRIAATADGRLAVIDGQSQKVHLLSLSGSPLGAFGVRRAAVDGFLFLSDLAPLEDGHLLVADQPTDTVREFRLRGEPGVYVANIATENRDAGIPLVAPLAIAGDGKGLLFVLDDWGGRVGAYRLGDLPETQPR